MAESVNTLSFTCVQCGSDSEQPVFKNGAKRTLCSNACKIARHRSLAPDKDKERRNRERPTVPAYCLDCRVDLPSQRRKRCSKCQRARKRAKKIVAYRARRLCRSCGLVAIPIYSQRCEPCREAAKEANAQRAKQRSKIDGTLAARRKARKLKLRGVTVERVNPIEVLSRDGWKCKLCGVSTPRRLRGSYEPNAPEVDHIVPLAKGGEHSYKNVQCACRRCNLTKSDKPLGQLLLFG